MTDITGTRTQIQEEETDYRSAVGESMFTRVGQGMNFINTKQYDTHSWHLNNVLSKFPVVAGPDGIMTFLFNVEIAGFSYVLGNTGTAGTNTVDVHRLTGGTTDAGTIFSTRPSITSAAADGSYTVRDETTSTTLSLPTGHTLAVLSTSQFDAGDALRLDLDANGSGSQNFQFTIHFRPR